MIALLLCGLIAGACAAPQFGFGAGRRPPFFSNNWEDSLFNTDRYLAGLSKEMRELDDMLAEFSRSLTTTLSQEGVVGTEYKLTISLPDFDENDISVKAREGLLLIQASHKCAEGSVKLGTRNYLDMRTLPDNVNVTGNWIFEDGVLTITFPLKDGKKTSELTPTSTEFVELGNTERPRFGGSREEIETNVNVDAGDVDVGLGRGDVDKNNEIDTNEIPDRSIIEGTTLSVDLKDVEFVPVRY